MFRLLLSTLTYWQSPTQESKSGITASTEEIASPVSPLRLQDVELEMAQPQSNEPEEMEDRTFVPAQLPHFTQKPSELEPKPPDSST